VQVLFLFMDIVVNENAKHLKIGTIST